MRTSVRLGQVTMAVLALAAPMAAQGRGGGRDGGGRAPERAPAAARPQTNHGSVAAGRPSERVQQPQVAARQQPQVAARQQPQVAARQQPYRTDDRARIADRVHNEERARFEARSRVAGPPRVEERGHVDNNGIRVDRGRPVNVGGGINRGRPDGNGIRVENRGRVVDRPRIFERGVGVERWRGETRWRQENARIVFNFFSGPRYRYVPRYAYAVLPYEWETVIYDDGYFPVDYDQWMEPVPAELEYQLPPLYQGYRRFIFGGRLIVIDRFTRQIVMVVRI